MNWLKIRNKLGFMPKTLVINVTQEHIDKGLPYNSHKCPIALAIQDRIDGDITSTNVCITIARIFYTYYSLPQEANSFIRLFDMNKPVEPFSFTATKV